MTSQRSAFNKTFIPSFFKTIGTYSGALLKRRKCKIWETEGLKHARVILFSCVPTCHPESLLQIDSPNLVATQMVPVKLNKPPKSGIWETGLAEGAGSKSSKGGEEQESGTRFIP